MKGLILISPAGLAPHPPQELMVPADTLGFKLRLIDKMWDRNYTPQSIARVMGYFAPGYVKKAVTYRFGSDRWAAEDTQAIADYLYHISALPASGEYAMNTLLMAKIFSSVESPTQQRPRVLAREPITPEHLAHLTGVTETNGDGSAEDPVDLTANISSLTSTSPNGTPILILYGDNDWLCFPEVRSYVQTLQSCGLSARLSIIREAGHHLYMDNPDQYHDEIHDWVQDCVLKKGKKNMHQR